jgi:hypothetical protein
VTVYSVEAQIIVCYPSITYLPSELLDPEWISISDIPQLETDLAELREARKVAKKLHEYYHNVRITKSLPGGERMIVR